MPTCAVNVQYIWRKYSFLISHTLLHVIQLFFYAEQMALLWLDTDGVSVVISNIPHNVIFAPALTPKQELFQSFIVCCCLMCVSLHLRLKQARNKPQKPSCCHTLLILLYNQMAQHEVSLMGFELPLMYQPRSWQWDPSRNRYLCFYVCWCGGTGIQRSLAEVSWEWFS